MKMFFEIESVEDAQEFHKALAVLVGTAPTLPEEAKVEYEKAEAAPNATEPDTADVEDVEEAEEEEQEELELVDVKRAIREFENGTKHPAVKKAMRSYKVKTLKELDPEDYAPFIAKLESLAAESEDEDVEEVIPPKSKAVGKKDKAKVESDDEEDEAYTEATLRTLTRPIIRAKQSGKIRGILRENYGVEKMGDLDEDDYEAFADDIKALIKELGL